MKEIVKEMMDRIDDFLLKQGYDNFECEVQIRNLQAIVEEETTERIFACKEGAYV